MGIFDMFKKKEKNNEEEQDKSKLKSAVKELKEKLEHCCD